jgi:hypothetical protein
VFFRNPFLGQQTENRIELSELKDIKREVETHYTMVPPTLDEAKCVADGFLPDVVQMDWSIVDGILEEYRHTV